MSRLFDVPMLRWVPLGLLLLAGCSTGADQAAVCANVWCPIGVCHANGDQPECRCTTWDRAAGAPCDQLETVRVDAGTVHFYEGVTASLSRQSQEGTVSKTVLATVPDRFTFTTRQGDDYRFVVTATSPGVSWTVELTEGDDVRLQTATATDQAAGRVDLHAIGVSRYTVTVARGPGDESKAGSYGWAFSETNPNDQGSTAATAQALSVGTTAGSIDFVGDVDDFRFEGEAGRIYWFRVNGYSVTPRLTDPAGAELEPPASFRVGGVSGYGFMHTEPRAWTGIVEMAQPGAVDLGLGGVPYSIQIEDDPPDVVGDTPATATPIPLGTQWTGRLDLPGDTDVYAFPVVAERNYLLQMGYSRPALTGLLAGDGGLVRSFTAGQTGVGYASFHGSPLPSGNDVFGDFSFSVLEAPPDEAGGTPDASTPLAIDSTTSGYCLPEGDVDVFSINADPMQYLIVSASCGGGGCVWSHNSPDFQIRVQWNGVESYILKAPPSGPLIATLSSGVPYTLQVLDGGFDDFPDVPDQGPTVTLGTPISGAIQWGYDRDCFKIDLVGGTRYEATTTGGLSAVIDGIAGYGSDLVFTAPDSGTYPLTVVNLSLTPSLQPAPYVLSVTPAP